MLASWRDAPNEWVLITKLTIHHLFVIISVFNASFKLVPTHRTKAWMHHVHNHCVLLFLNIGLHLYTLCRKGSAFRNLSAHCCSKRSYSSSICLSLPLLLTFSAALFAGWLLPLLTCVVYVSYWFIWSSLLRIWASMNLWLSCYCLCYYIMCWRRSSCCPL